MKHNPLFSLFLVFLSPLFLQAQTTQGTVSLSLHNFSPLIPESGGLLAPTNALGISFTTSESKENGVKSPSKTKISSVGFNMSAHYFLINNLSAGLNLNVFSQKYKETGGGGNFDAKTTVFMAGPELNYFVPVAEKVKVWFGGNASFGTAKSEFAGDDDDDPTKLSRISGGAGLAFFPNAHISMDLGLGYGVFKSKYESTDFSGQTSRFEDINSGITLDVGFSAYF